MSGRFEVGQKTLLRLLLLLLLHTKPPIRTVRDILGHFKVAVRTRTLCVHNTLRDSTQTTQTENDGERMWACGGLAKLNREPMSRTERERDRERERYKRMDR